MSRFLLFVVLGLFACCSLFSGSNSADSGMPSLAAPGGETRGNQPTFVTRAPAYPLDTCVVSGKPLGNDAVTFTTAGHTFTTCCPKCRTAIEAAPTTYVAKLEAATLQAQLPGYPLTTCPISGRTLGEPGEPVNLVLDGVLVRVCCERCVASAREQAATVVDSVRAAAFARQLATYPLDRCIVSGRPLGADPVSTMAGTTLVRFCCQGCAAKFDAAPTTYLPKLATATDSAFVAINTTSAPTTCCVTGKPLGDTAVTFTAGGVSFTTCCAECQPKVEADPQTFARTRDAATIAAQLPEYPLTTCPISGKTLGSMGTPVDLVLDGTLVRLCCDHCTTKATKDAATVATTVRTAALHAQQTNYPLATCPVSGRPLGKGAVSAMVGTTLVRMCCGECETKLTADPAPFVNQVQQARAAAAKAATTDSCCNPGGRCCCQAKTDVTTTTTTTGNTTGK